MTLHINKKKRQKSTLPLHWYRSLSPLIVSLSLLVLSFLFSDILALNHPGWPCSLCTLPSYLCSFSHRQSPPWHGSPYGVSLLTFSSPGFLRGFSLSAVLPFISPFPIFQKWVSGVMVETISSWGAISCIMPLEQEHRIFPNSFHHRMLFSVTSAPPYLIPSLLASPSVVSCLSHQSPSSLYGD